MALREKVKSAVCATSNHSSRIDRNRYVLTTEAATPQIAVLHISFSGSLAPILVDSGRYQLVAITSPVHGRCYLFFWDWEPERLKLEAKARCAYDRWSGCFYCYRFVSANRGARSLSFSLCGSWEWGKRSRSALQYLRVASGSDTQGIKGSG